MLAVKGPKKNEAKNITTTVNTETTPMTRLCQKGRGAVSQILLRDVSSILNIADPPQSKLIELSNPIDLLALQVCSMIVDRFSAPYGKISASECARFCREDADGKKLLVMMISSKRRGNREISV